MDFATYLDAMPPASRTRKAIGWSIIVALIMLAMSLSEHSGAGNRCSPTEDQMRQFWVIAGTRSTDPQERIEIAKQLAGTYQNLCETDNGPAAPLPSELRAPSR